LPKRIAKRIKKPRNVWLRELVASDPELGLGLDWTAEELRLRAPSEGLCAVCKGSKLLCGKTRCPVIARLTSYLKIWKSTNELSVDGSSPPSVFVGRFGYPYVNVGPMTPPFHGDTSMLDAPERWLGKTIDDIIDFRSQLIRGMYRMHVKKLDDAGRILERTRELSLSDHYVETEMKLKRRPRKRFYVDGTVQPIGPTAPLERIDIGYIRWDGRMEKAHYDTDLKAAEATKMLFDDGVTVSRIQRAFSLGSFGIERNRRLVPTRWSITAVDDIVSKELANRIKNYPQVNQFEVHESDYLGNRFEVLLVPDSWSYEAYEAWYPKTLWNPSADHVAMVTDWEGYGGRWRYASMGGCYYAGRLAVLEHLARVRRQAKVFILREAYPDYILPVGVWQVRENVRNAMRQPPKKYDTMEEALGRMMSRLSIGLDHWLSSGWLLRQTLIQKKLTEFI